MRQIAVLVLVNDDPHLESRPARTIAEFFILRKYRRQGVGDMAARHVFDLFPGPWEALAASRRNAASGAGRSRRLITPDLPGSKHRHQVLPK